MQRGAALNLSHWSPYLRSGRCPASRTKGNALVQVSRERSWLATVAGSISMVGPFPTWAPRSSLPSSQSAHLGICLPSALVLLERWRARHTHIDGQRLMFSGTGLGLFLSLGQVLPVVHAHLWDLYLLGRAEHPAVESRAHRVRPHLATQHPGLTPTLQPFDITHLVSQLV